MRMYVDVKVTVRVGKHAKSRKSTLEAIDDMSSPGFEAMVVDLTRILFRESKRLAKRAEGAEGLDNFREGK